MTGSHANIKPRPMSMVSTKSKKENKFSSEMSQSTLMEINVSPNNVEIIQSSTPIRNGRSRGNLIKGLSLAALPHNKNQKQVRVNKHKYNKRGSMIENSSDNVKYRKQGENHSRADSQEMYQN